MSAEWITHRGKRVLYGDCKGLSEEEMLAVIEKMAEMALESGESEVLTLLDLEGAFGTPHFMSEAKRIGNRTMHLIKKGAFITDVSVTKKILFQTYNALTGGKRKLFQPGENALDWLVE